MKLLSLVVFIFLIAPHAFSQEVRVDNKETNNFLSASLEYSSLSLAGGSIDGQGLRLDFDHFFTDKYDIEIYLSTALNSGGSGQSSFTGFGGYFYYTLMGNCCNIVKKANMDGVPILIENNYHKNSLAVGAGLDQFFLNGSKSVYSVSGVGIGGNYQFSLWDYHMKAEARYSMLSSSAITITGIFFAIGFTFGI